MKNERTILYSDIHTACLELQRRIVNMLPPSGHRASRIYGIPRGGVAAAYAFMHHAHELDGNYTMAYDPHAADLILDDLIDSGDTMKRYGKYSAVRAALFTKGQAPESFAIYGHKYATDGWLTFPWEKAGDEDTSANDIPLRLLQYIGEDAQREGLKETPKRFLKAWKHWTEGYAIKPEDVLKHFVDGSEKTDEMVLVKRIPVYSHCEHHMAPFFGVAHVSYIPNGKIAGLSKLSRLVDVFAKRLQVQERLTQQIADALQEHLKPRGVGVILECRHMCMESRGIQRSNCATVTSAMRGVMMDKPEARAELLSLIRG